MTHSKLFKEDCQVSNVFTTKQRDNYGIYQQNDPFDQEEEVDLSFVNKFVLDTIKGFTLDDVLPSQW